MKERGILFSAPMVRALLSGTKTQTRRVANTGLYAIEARFHGEETAARELAALSKKCPYGQPGERLWVRETWGVVSNAWSENGDLIDWTPDRPATSIAEMAFGQGYYSGHVIYAADGSYEWAGDDDGGGEPRSAWHPSIHMPRAASRILLEIVSVRVERLNDCSEADAMAEGVAISDDPAYFWVEGKHIGMNARETYAELWESINGASSWAANPWVWVVEFTRVTS